MRSLIFEGYIRGVEGGEGISGKGREGVFIFDTNMMDKRRFLEIFMSNISEFRITRLWVCK